MSKKCSPQTCQIVNGRCKFRGKVISGMLHDCSCYGMSCFNPKKLSNPNPQFMKIEQCPCPAGPQGPPGTGNILIGPTGPQGKQGVGITGPQGAPDTGNTGSQGPQGIGVTGTLFFVETSDSQTGPIIDGPFPITKNDTLRFWSAGGIEAMGEAGSALIQLEPNNILTSNGPPTQPPTDPTRPVIYVDSNTGELYTWNPDSTTQSPTGPTGGTWNDPITPTTPPETIDSTLCEGGGINWEKLSSQKTYQNEFKINTEIIDSTGSGPTGSIDNSQYGESISISGNVWAVGAPKDGQDQKGLVHVYAGETLCQVLTPSQSDATNFGQEVSLNGDFLFITDLAQNIDVYQRNPTHNRFEFSHAHTTTYANKTETTLSSATPFYAVSHPNQDTVTIYHNPTTNPFNPSNPPIISPNISQTIVKASDLSFGTDISLNSNRIAVGAPNSSTIGEVSLYIYNSGTTIWEEEQVITAPTGGTGFGQSVSLSNNNLAISHPQKSEVYVYGINQTTNIWTLHTTLSNLGSPQQVKLSGATLAVSHPSTNQIFIFQPSSSDAHLWILKNTLAQSNITSINFGHAIALSGDKIVSTSTSGVAPVDSYIENFDSCTTFNIPPTWTRDPDPGSVGGSTFCWQCRSTETNSSNTGPLTDKSGSGFYIYLETSSGSNGDEGYLITPQLTIGPSLSFWYHMHGATIGSLHVDISIDGGSNWINDITPALVGEQQVNQSDPYLQRTIDLSAYSGETNGFIRFRGIRGSSFTGDIAIDEVEMPRNKLFSANSFYYCATPRVSTQTKQLYTLDYESGSVCWLDQTTLTQNLESTVINTTDYQIDTTPSQSIPDFSDTMTLQMDGDCFQFWGTYALPVTNATTETFTIDLPITLPNNTQFPPLNRNIQSNTTSGTFQGKFSDNTPIWGGIIYSKTINNNTITKQFVLQSYATTATLPANAEIQFQICGKLVKESILPILVTPTITHSCPSQNNGSIQLDVAGNDPFIYLWSNGETGSTITNLEPNDYEVNITDSIGVQFTDTYTIITQNTITNLQIDNITSTTADLSWTSGITGTSQWDITIGTPSFTPSDPPTDPNVSTNPYQAVGLSPSTNYEFYIREDCNGATGAWVGPSPTFTTLP